MIALGIDKGHKCVVIALIDINIAPLHVQAEIKLIFISGLRFLYFEAVDIHSHQHVISTYVVHFVINKASGK